MDLSFTRFEADVSVRPLMPELAVLLVGVAARQAASPTALAQVRIDRLRTRPARFAPTHGAFDDAVARLLRATSRVVNSVFTEPGSAPSSRGDYGRYS